MDTTTTMNRKALADARYEFIAIQVNEEAYGGRRCEICAAIISDPSGVSDASQADGRCPRHNENTDSEEMTLARLALIMKADFRSHLLRGTHKDTEIFHESHSGPIRRIIEALIFKRQCLHSLSFLARPCYDIFVDQGETIADILELEFSTQPEYGFKHNVFVIITKTDNKYIFDPTGVQFGASWPLLQPYNEYKKRVYRLNIATELFGWCNHVDTFTPNPQNERHSMAL